MGSTFDRKKLMTINPEYPYRFPIQPLIDVETRKWLYVDYQRKKGCDCTLICKDGERVKMHASILRKHFFSVKLNDILKTSAAKELVIPLEEYSDLAVYAFVESLYLPSKIFKEKLLTWAIPIFELTRFACDHDQLGLHKICVEVICETPTDPRDAEAIRQVNERYGNIFLDRLYKQLIQSQDKT